MTDLHQGDGYYYDITPPKPKANGSDERKSNDSSAHHAPRHPSHGSRWFGLPISRRATNQNISCPG